MISAHLLDEILAVAPTWDGIHRPRLDEEETYAETRKRRLARERAEARELREFRDVPTAPDLAARREVILEVLRGMPGATTVDVAVAVHKKLGLTGVTHGLTANSVGRILRHLTKAGRVRSVEMKSKREVLRAGGRVLWEAV